MSYRTKKKPKWDGSVWWVWDQRSGFRIKSTDAAFDPSGIITHKKHVDLESNDDLPPIPFDFDDELPIISSPPEDRMTIEGTWGTSVKTWGLSREKWSE